jgi:hypothetical protein
MHSNTISLETQLKFIAASVLAGLAYPALCWAPKNKKIFDSSTKNKIITHYDEWI